MNISKIVEDKIAAEIDLSKYQKEIDKAISDYFKSERFMDDVAEILSEEGIGWDLGKIIAEQLRKSIKGKVKFNIG